MAVRLSQIVTALYCAAREACRWPCRQCRERVQLFEEVCPECGTFDPLRIPCQTVMKTAIGCVVAIQIVRLTELLGR